MQSLYQAQRKQDVCAVQKDNYRAAGGSNFPRDQEHIRQLRGDTDI